MFPHTHENEYDEDSDEYMGDVSSLVLILICYITIIKLYIVFQHYNTEKAVFHFRFI